SDVVFDVEPPLDFPAPVGLIDGTFHRIGHPVRIQDCPAIDVARSPADSLNERIARPQESFFIRVENGDERYLRQIESLAKQINADQHVEFTAPQAAQDLDAIERCDLGVQLSALHA